MAHDVFISYSSKDKTIADGVCSKLEEQKIRCWIAPRDVPAGQNFAESIIEAIETCKVFVLIWSANTNTSEHILNENNQAFEQGIIIIPFRIQDVQPTRAMRYYFGRTHWLDAITPPMEKHIGYLAQTIFANLGRQPEVAPESQPVKAEPAREEGKSIISSVEKQKLVTKEKKAEKPLVKPGLFRSMKDEIKEVEGPENASKKGVSFLPIAAGAVVLVTLIVLMLSGVFKVSSPPPSEPENSPSTTLPTLTAATATTTPPWVVEFAEPILSVKKYQPPLFQDDFSSDQQNWQLSTNGTQCSNTAMSIKDGVIQLKTGGDCLAFACLPKLQLNNFVLQVDVDIKRITDGGSYQINWRRSGANVVRLDGDRSWALILYGDSDNIDQISSGTLTFDEMESATITVISKEPSNAVYINDVPVALLTDDRDWQFDSNSSFCLVAFSPVFSTFAFDNFIV